MRLLTLLLPLSLACAAAQNRPTVESLDEEPVRTLREAFELTEETGGETQVRLLDENVDAWATRWALISGAQRTIDTTYFIVEPDVFGMSMIGLLLRKAQQGVKVRLMVDSRGTFALSHKGLDDVMQELLATGNAEVRSYNPVENQLAESLATLDFKPMAASNHDKMILVDDERAIMGGRNISRDYLSHPIDHKMAFVDVDILLTGGEVMAKLKQAFDDEYLGPRTRAMSPERFDFVDQELPLTLVTNAMEAWLASEPTPGKPDALALELEGKVIGPLAKIPNDTARAKLKTATLELAALPRLRGSLNRVGEVKHAADVRILDSHSSEGVGKNDINQQVVRMVAAAEREVVVQNPYVVLSKYGLEVLKRASDRGVQITVLTNSPTSSDSALTQALFLRAWKEILAAVPNLRIFVLGEEHLLHSKVGVFDGQVTMLGSYNLDYLSAYVNSEIVASVWSEELAQENRRVIYDHIDRGAPYVFEYKIQRDEEGNVVRDVSGEIVVEYGPEDHCAPEKIAEIKRLQVILEPVRAMPDLAPLL